MFWLLCSCVDCTTMCWLCHHVLTVVPPCFDCGVSMFQHAGTAPGHVGGGERWKSPPAITQQPTTNTAYILWVPFPPLCSPPQCWGPLWRPGVYGMYVPGDLDFMDCMSLVTCSLWNVCPWWHGVYRMYVPGDMEFMECMSLVTWSLWIVSPCWPGVMDCMSLVTWSLWIVCPCWPGVMDCMSLGT